MKRKLKAAISSVFLRIVLSYAFLMLLVFTCIGIYMNNYYSSTIKKNYIEDNINTLSRIRYLNESSLTQLFNIARQITVSPDISPFHFLEEGERSYRLKEQLAAYKVNTDFFKQIFLLFDDDDYLYSSSTSINMNMLLTDGIVYENTSSDEFYRLMRSHVHLGVLPAQNATGILISGSPYGVVTFVTPIGYNNGVSYGVLLFLVDVNSYYDFFSQEISNKRNMYITYKGGILVGQEELELSPGVLEKYISNNGETLVKPIKDGGHDYMLISLPGSMYEMQYVTVVPMDSFMELMKSEQWSFWLFIFALSVPCSVLIAVLSKRNYKPIRELLGKNTVLSSYLEESRNIRKAEVVKHFIKGRYQSRTEFVNVAEGVGLQVDKRFFMVVLEGLHTGAETAVMSVNMLDSAPGDAVSGFGVELIAQEHMLYALFADDEAALYAWVESVYENSRSIKRNIIMAASCAHNDFSNAPLAYLEANAAYDSRFLVGTDKAILFVEISAKLNSIMSYPQKYMDTLKNAVRTGDMANVYCAIDNLLHYFRTIDLSIFSFRCIYNDIINVLIKERMSKGGDLNTLKIYDVFTLSGCLSIEDLDDKLRKTCQELIQAECISPDSNSPSSISKIVEYMQENFNDPCISMAAIADRFGLSPTQLSIDFKEVMCMSPSEYLMLLRIEKAKEFLRMTDTSIKDISVKVGYYDVSGFIRRFKGFTSMTPLQYRQSMGR